MRTRFIYDQPQGQLFERGRTTLKDAIVFGRDDKGQPIAWSTLNQQQTDSLLKEHGLQQPEAVD